MNKKTKMKIQLNNTTNTWRWFRNVHIFILQEDNIKGKLSDRIHDKNIKITENDLLRYLKQLVWIVHQLHEEYNIVHRNLTADSF